MILNGKILPHFIQYQRKIAVKVAEARVRNGEWAMMKGTTLFVFYFFFPLFNTTDNLSVCTTLSQYLLVSCNCTIILFLRTAPHTIRLLIQICRVIGQMKYTIRKYTSIILWRHSKYQQARRKSKINTSSAKEAFESGQEPKIIDFIRIADISVLI